jgi:hypothetical protein
LNNLHLVSANGINAATQVRNGVDCLMSACRQNLARVACQVTGSLHIT